MGKVTARVDVAGKVSEAEALWYSTLRWPAFIDGLANVSKLEDGWPDTPGARLIWDSRQGGRGRVIEQVVSHEMRVGQVAAVEDEHIRGTQTVHFEALADDRTRVTLSLDYEIKRERGVKPIVDLVFVRRPFRDSLKRTLHRFARELRDEREGL
jgi:hypothetical protein